MGKSSLTLKFCKNDFSEGQESTVDATCLENSVVLENNKQAKLKIWDTAGQERYHALNANYYRGS